MYLDRLGEALSYAGKAVALNPDNCTPRSILGGIYWTLHHFDRAEVEWEIAMSLNPGHDTITRIARVYWTRAFALRDRGARRKAHSRAIELFSHALAIAESRFYSLEEWELRVKVCGKLHYQLGWFYH